MPIAEKSEPNEAVWERRIVNALCQLAINLQFDLLMFCAATGLISRRVISLASS
jgi:hypothetical protein